LPIDKVKIGRRQTISLKLPDDLLAELEREARTRRITKSVLVRESLEAACADGGGVQLPVTTWLGISRGL
jgi:predicted transcriptional regulator